MAKFGKIFLAVLLLGMISIFPVASQEYTKAELQHLYTEFLRAEGYLPSIDNDGDILFKVSGDSYYIIIDENDLQFFRIYTGVSLGAVSLEDALDAANFSNRHSKVAKIYISSDGRSAAINTELLLEDPVNFMPIFTRALAVMRNAENNFLSQVR